MGVHMEIEHDPGRAFIANELLNGLGFLPRPAPCQQVPREGAAEAMTTGSSPRPAHLTPYRWSSIFRMNR
jgi:hypothetical protein